MFDVDIVYDAQARRMKGIVEASRKAALHQRDARIAPPEDDSDGKMTLMGALPRILPREMMKREYPIICPRRPMVKK